MAYQLNITNQNVTFNWSKFWLFSKIFLFFLLAVTLLPSLIKVSPTFYISNIVLCLLFITVALIIKFKRKQELFIRIENNQLQYFCPVKKELITIPSTDITKVTTQFCELQIHTNNRTHCLSMEKIKQETQRWEIKEMIKKLAEEHGNQLIINEANKAS